LHLSCIFWTRAHNWCEPKQTYKTQDRVRRGYITQNQARRWSVGGGGGRGRRKKRERLINQQLPRTTKTTCRSKSKQQSQSRRRSEAPPPQGVLLSACTEHRRDEWLIAGRRKKTITRTVWAHMCWLESERRRRGGGGGRHLAPGSRPGSPGDRVHGWQGGTRCPWKGRAIVST
jgi:hypothetical protein